MPLVPKIALCGGGGKLDRNDPYMTMFNNCSNGSGQFHVKVTQTKNRFSR